MNTVVTLHPDPLVTLPVPFASASDAWEWYSAAVVARCREEDIEGSFPLHPATLEYAAMEAGWSRMHWQIMLDATFDGEPECPMRAVIYRDALAKLGVSLGLMGLL